MKILLLGDLSSLHKNLKEGIQSLGHEVYIYSSGDGFKKSVKSDISLLRSDNLILRRLDSLLLYILNFKDMHGFDVVQLAQTNIFGGKKYNFNYNCLKKIKNISKKMFLSSAGTNSFVYNVSKQLRYNYFYDHIHFDLNGVNKYISKDIIKNDEYIIDLVDGIIPIAYTYSLAFKDNFKLTRTIPLPINCKKISFYPQVFKNKRILIFHGITRKGFKGSRYIIEAMEKIHEKYPNDVEIIIDGKMPLEKYLKVLEDTNIVVDQALSYSYGMNAVYSMAMGKVVLSGNEPEFQQEFGRDDIPVINILPSVEDIFAKLEHLVLNRDLIVEIGKKSRLFVEDFHDCVKVAQQYIDVWNSVKK